MLASENLRKETKQRIPLLLRDFQLSCTFEILNCTDLIVWVTKIIWHKEEKGCSYLGEGGKEGRKRKKYDVKCFPSMFRFRSIFLMCAPSEEYLSVWNLKRIKTPAPSHPTPSPSCLKNSCSEANWLAHLSMTMNRPMISVATRGLQRLETQPGWALKVSWTPWQWLRTLLLYPMDTRVSINS